MINIKLTKKQAMIMEVALDTYFRIACGQLGEIVRCIDHAKGNWTGTKIEFEVERLLKTSFPDLFINCGIRNLKLINAQIAYEMVKVLQNLRAKDIKYPGVLANKPIHHSNESLIEVEEVKQ